MVECLSLKGEKIQMLKTARQEKSSWVFKWPCCLEITTQPQICCPSPTTPLLPEGFRNLKFACGCCPLAPLVTSRLPEITLIHSAGASCTSCFSSDLSILFPSLSTSSPPTSIAHTIMRLQTVLCWATLHPRISLLAHGQKSLLELGFLTEQLT